MPPHVAWTRRAQTRCNAALEGGRDPAAVPPSRADLGRRLEAAFADATDVVVLNYYVGFKKRPDEHILRVDVHREHAANTYVVKFAKHDRLERELKAWNQCGLTDPIPVFMPLLAVPDPERPDQLCALAYQDAEAHIGSESTLWLEAAAQQAVRFDRPTAESIRAALGDVFAQARRLYERAELESPRVGGIETMPDRGRLGKRHQFANLLEPWGEPKALAIRRRVGAAFAVGFPRFVDPVDYYVFLDHLQQKEPVLPRLLRGLAHGDLHGRNLLVGLDVREAAAFPSLFDYEHIHPDNLVGWDFVEMETELKIRCYSHVFPDRTEPARIRCIQEFEWRLAEETRKANETGRWDVEPATAGAGTAEDRLLAILLGIRQEAHATLNPPHSGEITWLHEYLFLLGAYSLTTVRYENQTPLERTAGYVSAGVAAAYWEHLGGPRPKAASADGPHPGHHVPLAGARRWNRGGSDDLDRAAELLARLVDRYPTSLHVRYEQAFNLLQRGQHDDAARAIERIQHEFDDALDEDTYSLWGRCHKEKGSRHLERGLKSGRGSAVEVSEFEEADEAYRLAIVRYQQAFDLSGGFFSAINLATLLFLLGGLKFRLGSRAEADALRARSRVLAEPLRHVKVPSNLPDDNIWIRATQAEAAVLCGDFAYAAERYRLALELANRQAHYLDSIGKQLRRLIDAHGLYGETVPRKLFDRAAELLDYFPEETAP